VRDDNPDTASATPQPKLEAVVANWYPRFLANGLDGLQVRDTLARIQRWEQWAPEWVASAQAWEERGAAALEAGHLVTAGEHLTRAALTLQFAQFVLTEDVEQRTAIHRRQIELYRQAAPLLRPPAEPVAMPFEDTAVPGYLRRPAGAVRPRLVILIPGLESTKEQFSTFEPYFLARGVATLSMEGPGQGEMWYERGFNDADYRRAFRAVLNFARSLDDLDHDRLALVGTSFGGYLGLKCAPLAGERLAGVVEIAGPYDLAAFDDLQPVLQDGFAHLVKAPDRATAKRRLADVTLQGALDDLHAPVLVIHGGRDAVIPPNEANRIAAALGDRAEVWFEPEGNHSCNNLFSVVRPAVADWVADRLTGHR
jgi:dipeptidyl aminopeptidase/acylaminoacyl peptidase